MNKRVVIVGLIILIAGLAVCTTSAMQRIQVPYQVPYQDFEDREKLLGVEGNFSIRKGEYASWSYSLIKGRNISVTWQAENRVDVYFMNDSQYNVFSQTLAPQYYIRFFSALSGFFPCTLPYNDTFHVVIYNDPWLNISSVKTIYYELRLTWQEQVTKFETKYKEEPYYLGLGVGLAIFVIGCVIAALGWALRLKRPKFIQRL